jgi:hypothetical protein
MSILQRTPEWRRARASRITGSRIAVILGHSPYQSRRQLLGEMVREAHGLFEERDSPAMRWGREHESTAFDNFVMHFAGLDDQFTLGGWYELGEAYGFSPDAVTATYLLELKAPYSQRLPAEPDLHYVDQCRLGMLVCNRPRAYLHYWTPAMSRTFTIERDPEWEAMAAAEVEAFMVELRKALAAPEEWLVVERDDMAWLGEATRYKRCAEALKAAEEAMKDARRDLLALTDEQSTRGAGVRVTWAPRAGNVNWKAIAEAHNITQEEQDAYRGKTKQVATITIVPAEQ